ncbi:sugar phosphate isomerase/epimerase family protein [Tautonia sociabilis]|uniref:Sugar phosphate isomerase/epimerase n=1 Tax=Tautonia sociabilis TaxID=2080755 RepID=A0A432MCF0_9BACT|nr:sugar phosphate isomerase/epimerase [Tautonia sociabilis]RUL81710.1 sugar phosphate isomerase/epimerase [Tautonia sociabilis]
MKIGMNLLLWTDTIRPEHDPILEQLKAIGFDSVELPIFDGSDTAPYERLGKRLRELGLAATAVTVMAPQANPISPDASVRKAAVEHLDGVLACCAAAGAEVLCGPIHSALGQFSGAAPTDEEFKLGVDTLQRVAEKAKGHGVLLACEYLNRFENYFLTTAEQTARFVDAVGHPSCTMMYDSFHAHIEEKSQKAAIVSCGDRITHVHVSENDRGTPGTGQVHWDEYFEGLRAIGFDGSYTIEAFGRALPALAAATRVWRDLFPDPMGLCRDGFAFIKQRTGR